MGDFEKYNILAECGVGEIEEKKSKFIANFRLVETEEQAMDFIEEMKKKYWDARHNCSAFIIGRKAELVRCSDDGEPSQTAGRPMLEVLMGAGLRNAAVVVTRYFGGTLLGTGGLVRAYTAAVQEGLKNSRIARMRYGVELMVDTDYNGIGKLQYIMGKRGIPIRNTEFADTVKLWVLAPYEEAEGLEKEIIQATSAKAKITRLKSDYYQED